MAENEKKIPALLARVASSTKAKIILSVVICLLMILPAIVLFFAISSPSLPSVQDYDYLAMTDCHGKEYVYPRENIIFLTTAASFSGARHTDTPPEWWSEERAAIKLEFIDGGYAYPYSLYLHPYPLEAYLTDSTGNGYLLPEDAAAVLINTPTAGPSLVGELPPDITINKKTVGFSVCRWTFYVLPNFGSVFKVSSGEYLSERTEPYPISVDNFSCSFTETPISLSFQIYRGEEKILDTIAPDFEALPKGEYQLVVLAEFDRGLESVRAGYSFSFQID